jgi:hypothetical protein
LQLIEWVNAGGREVVLNLQAGMGGGSGCGLSFKRRAGLDSFERVYRTKVRTHLLPPCIPQKI